MPVERTPCVGIEDKYVDALIQKQSSTLFVDLALLLIISRYECVPSVPELSKLLSFDEIVIEVSLINLHEIGFLIKN